jgi:hypothetical protein
MGTRELIKAGTENVVVEEEGEQPENNVISSEVFCNVRSANVVDESG